MGRDRFQPSVATNWQRSQGLFLDVTPLSLLERSGRKISFGEKEAISRTLATCLASLLYGTRYGQDAIRARAKNALDSESRPSIRRIANRPRLASPESDNALWIAGKQE